MFRIPSCSSMIPAALVQSKRYLTNFRKHFLPLQSPFVECTNYRNSTRERIIWPAKNFPDSIPEIADKLNEVTKYAFFGRGLGANFIQTQLKDTKFLDLYRDKKSDEVRQYVRLDVYNQCTNAPISMGIFKMPGFLNESRNVFAQIALRELSDRVTSSNPNPSVFHINCAFSPRGYEICKVIADKITPNTDLIYKSLKPEDHAEYASAPKTDLSDKPIHNHVAKVVEKQLLDEDSNNPAMAEVTKFYLNKMQQATQTHFPFVASKSQLVGCIPIPSDIVSSLDAHDEKITNFFHTLLKVADGDMLLFYSDVSYENLKRKIEEDLEN